jgi:hypothetical protein
MFIKIGGRISLEFTLFYIQDENSGSWFHVLKMFSEKSFSLLLDVQQHLWFDECTPVGENGYVPCGPVAQLGARFHGMEEVVGSIPTRSTIFSTIYSLSIMLSPQS